MLPNNTLLHHRYRIEKLLAAGGMGAVYKARDERLNVIVAVKEALVSDPALLAAFEKEAQRLARLRHGALPNVMDHFIENYRQYLVMEYIEGEDLAEKLAKRGAPFSVAEVLGWGDQLLAVLEYLHGQQPAIIHRDIKPQNVKVMPDNTLILLDFGLAKGGLTQHSGTLVHGHTPGYAPLEQMKGHRTDARSDLYSVSATLWNLLTAQQPVDARLREQAATHRMPDPLRPANELNPNVPPPLAQLLHQALALHPNQRPPNATTMRAMLRHELERPQREAEAARRQAEEARRQAEVDKLQRELEAARRQAEYQRKQREQAEAAHRQAEYDRKQREQAEAARHQAEYDRKQREQAEAARRQAEYERKQREQAEAARRQAEYERKQREQAEAARRQAEYERKQREEAEAARRQAEYQRKQREQAEAARRQAEYQRKQREQAEAARRQAEVKQTGKWLVSSLIWLPFLYPTLALGLETLPHSADASSPTTYLWISGALFIPWLFTGIFGDSEDDGAEVLLHGVNPPSV